jgi:hypothetical protein
MKISPKLLLSLMIGTQTLIAQDSNYRNISRYEMLAYENDSNCIVTLIKSKDKGFSSLNYYKIVDKKTKKAKKVVIESYNCLECGMG